MNVSTLLSDAYEEADRWSDWAVQHSAWLKAAADDGIEAFQRRGAVLRGPIGFVASSTMLSQEEREELTKVRTYSYSKWKPPIIITASMPYGDDAPKYRSLFAEFYTTTMPAKTVHSKGLAAQLAHRKNVPLVTYNQLHYKTDCPSWLLNRLEKKVVQSEGGQQLLATMKVIGVEKPTLAVTASSGTFSSFGLLCGRDHSYYGRNSGIPVEYVGMFYTALCRMLRPIAEEMIEKGLYAHAALEN